MTPTRRTILVATACGLTTGCVASTLNDENDPPDERELTSVTTSVPDDAPFAWEATVLQRRINSDQTAEFDLRVTWQGEETVEYRFGSTIPLGDPKYSESPTASSSSLTTTLDRTTGPGCPKPVATATSMGPTRCGTANCRRARPPAGR